MKLLVTEAYSASNVGDLELVSRSIQLATDRYKPDELICLAVDPDSFAAALPAHDFADRLFPRLSYMKTEGVGRVLIAARWTVAILLLTASALVGKGLARSTTRAVVRLGLLGPTASDYLEASHVVAVGGGYLGDQYKKETLLTTWSWWWASRIGCHVETMPVSVEVHSRWLGLWVRLLTRKVQWRVRDSSSAKSLERARTPHSLVPDLAFLNFNGAHGARPRSGVGIALVGSDYLSPNEFELLVGALSASLKALNPSRVLLVSMHRSLAGTSVGADIVAAKALESRMDAVPFVHLRARSYDEVCESLSSCEFVVSARMHAGIAALCVGTRVGLLAYEEKHFALMRDLGLDQFVIDIRASAREIDGLISRLELSTSDVFRDAAEGYRQRLEQIYG